MKCHYYAFHMSGNNSVVECQLPKLNVAGSSPVSRSMFASKFNELRVSIAQKIRAKRVQTC